ncbi:MAG: FAD-dependent oxidoreductase [Kiritimatiellaeota bacterium]|nr:FAD-dependent oxidoreductase [Kiritimatiellota bacterium]
MSAPTANAWRCEVCGYIHEGPEPPAECPVCGAPASDFTPCAQPGVPFVPAPAATQMAQRIVVIGGGIAGVSAAEAARQTSPDSEITLLSAEPELPYWRLNLTRLLDGELQEDALPLHPADWYVQQRIRLLSGVTATALTLDRHEVACSNGETLTFDKLILATGANAFLPPWPGVTLGGVQAVRTLADTRAILQRVRPGLRCVCVGGGILGLETAGALAKHGVQVDLLAGDGWLMPRQLTRAGGEILARHVAALGVHLHTAAKVRTLDGHESVNGLTLENGERMPADLVLVTTGIRANLVLATAAGLTTRQGIVVDDWLTTSHPDVFAAGDCAEHQGVLYGLWPAAHFQGTLAGMNAAGQRSAFGGLPRLNVLKVLGLHVFSIGQFEAPAAQVLEQQTNGQYLRFAFLEGRLCGAILIGRDGLDAVLKTAIEQRRDFSAALAQSPTASNFADLLAAPSA